MMDTYGWGKNLDRPKGDLENHKATILKAKPCRGVHGEGPGLCLGRKHEAKLWVSQRK